MRGPGVGIGRRLRRWMGSSRVGCPRRGRCVGSCRGGGGVWRGGFRLGRGGGGGVGGGGGGGGRCGGRSRSGGLWWGVGGVRGRGGGGWGGRVGTSFVCWGGGVGLRVPV